MTVYHYNNSSQVVRKGDRVRLPDWLDSKYGEITELYLWQGWCEPGADVQVEDGTLKSVPIAELTFLAPEAELAQAQANLLDAAAVAEAELAAFAPRLQFDAYEVRREALKLAVKVHEPYMVPGWDRDKYAASVLAMASRFAHYLDPSGSGNQDTQS